jgi:hypothetical protein
VDDLTKRLLIYTDAASRKPFSYATGHDCGQGFVAEWVRQETGYDVAAPWRGRYRTAMGCLRLVQRSGGLGAIFAQAFEPIGMARVAEPLVGDVGTVIMDTDHGEQEVGAIMGLDGWLSLTGRGIRSSARGDFAAAWRLP